MPHQPPKALIVGRNGNPIPSPAISVLVSPCTGRKVSQLSVSRNKLQVSFWTHRYDFDRPKLLTGKVSQAQQHPQHRCNVQRHYDDKWSMIKSGLWVRIQHSTTRYNATVFRHISFRFRHWDKIIACVGDSTTCSRSTCGAVFLPVYSYFAMTNFINYRCAHELCSCPVYTQLYKYNAIQYCEYSCRHAARHWEPPQMAGISCGQSKSVAAVAAAVSD